jgi:hypothetical protein
MHARRTVSLPFSFGELNPAALQFSRRQSKARLTVSLAQSHDSACAMSMRARCAKFRAVQNTKLEPFKIRRVGLSRGMNATCAATLLVFDGF